MLLGLLWTISVVLSKRGQDVLSIVVEVVVVIDNHRLLAIDILNDSEWIKLHFVGDCILALD